MSGAPANGITLRFADVAEGSAAHGLTTRPVFGSMTVMWTARATVLGRGFGIKPRRLLAALSRAMQSFWSAASSCRVARATFGFAATSSRYQPESEAPSPRLPGTDDAYNLVMPNPSQSKVP